MRCLWRRSRACENLSLVPLAKVDNPQGVIELHLFEQVEADLNRSSTAGAIRPGKAMRTALGAIIRDRVRAVGLADDHAA